MKTHIIKKLFHIGVFISLTQAVTVHANDPMTVGDLIVTRNSVVAGNISISDAGDGVSTSIPVTVFNGANDGPVLALIAGIHGAEYSPILAMQQVVTMNK